MTTGARPVEPPVLLFDGTCGFCSSSVRVLRRLVGRLPAVEPYQTVDLAPLGLTADECREALRWVGADRRVCTGADAVAQVLVDAGRGWTLVGRGLRLPVVRSVAAVVYRWVARNRHRLPGGTPACSLDPSSPG